MKYIALVFFAFTMVLFFSTINENEAKRAKKIKYSQALTFQYGWLLSRQRLGVKYKREEFKKDSLHFIKTMYE